MALIEDQLQRIENKLDSSKHTWAFVLGALVFGFVLGKFVF